MKRYGQYGRKPSWIVHMRTPLPHPRLPVPGEALRVTFDDVTSSEKAPLRRILRNFRLLMRAHKGTPFGVTWHSVTSGSHGTCTTVLLYYYSIKKKRAGNRRKRRETLISGDVTSGHVTFCDVTFGYVTSGQACAMVRSSGFFANMTLFVPIYYSYPSMDKYNHQKTYPSMDKYNNQNTYQLYMGRDKVIFAEDLEDLTIVHAWPEVTWPEAALTEDVIEGDSLGCAHTQPQVAQYPP